MTNFNDALSFLTAKELPHARRDPARLSAMIERLTHALGMTIAVGSGDDSATAGTLSAGAQNYLDETVTDLLPLGAAVQNARGER